MDVIQRSEHQCDRYSLSRLADRKNKQLNARLKDGDMFAKSAILTTEEIRRLTYLSIPFLSHPPSTRLVYSSLEHSNSTNHTTLKLHERSSVNCLGVDGLAEEVQKVLGPSVLLIQVSV